MKNDTRAMVFCSFRHCVLEVVVSSQFDLVVFVSSERMEADLM